MAVLLPCKRFLRLHRASGQQQASCSATASCRLWQGWLEEALEPRPSWSTVHSRQTHSTRRAACCSCTLTLFNSSQTSHLVSLSLKISLLQTLGALVTSIAAAGADDPPLLVGNPQTLQSFTLSLLQDRLGDTAEVLSCLLPMHTMQAFSRQGSSTCKTLQYISICAGSWSRYRAGGRQHHFYDLEGCRNSYRL